MINIIGAGLAGSEAAWQLAERGHAVRLWEMKPNNFSPAHHSADCAELVCTNSLRSDLLHNGAGLLKAEMRLLQSLLLAEADRHRVPAGGALAVDREAFSAAVTARLAAHPLISLERQEVRDLTAFEDQWTLVATGPLTSPDLLADLERRLGASLYFFDAAAPIVARDSLDDSIVFKASRYDESGDGDYWNCPMNREEYERFYQALITADCAEVHDFEEKRLFAGCQPIESIAKQGADAMRFGPLKPVGLKDPRTGREPYACLQLRAETADAQLLNLVGFQTRLKFPEQKRVFGLIPGLASAVFERYGVMHKNAFVNGPTVFARYYQLKAQPKCFIIGQLSGVEGYLESGSSGLLAARYLDWQLRQAAGEQSDLPAYFSRETMIGALAEHVASATTRDFQPMKANFGLLESVEGKALKALKAEYGVSESGRKGKRLALARRALAHFAQEGQ